MPNCSRRIVIFLSTLLLFFTSTPHIFPEDTEDTFEEDSFLFDDSEGITIVGTPKTSQHMAVIEKEDIERRNAADLASLLQEALNVNITRYGSYGNQAGISLRGFDSKRIAFLIDGTPANSSIDGKFDIEHIDLNTIERIEVIYGGSDSKYNVSGALGGVINIITVKKQTAGLKLNGSLANTSAIPGEYRDRSNEKQDPHWEDLIDTQNYSLSAAYGAELFSLSTHAFANRAHNHFLFSDYTGMIRRKDNNEVWDTGASASLVYDLPNYSKLIASSQFYYGDKNFPASGFSANAGNQQDSSFRQNLMLDTPRAFHDDLGAEASLTWHFKRRNFTASGHDQHSLNAINRWNWYAADILILRSGIDSDFTWLDSTDMGLHSRYNGGFYLTAEYKPLTSLLIIPSIKTVFTSDADRGITFVPKLGFLWNVTDSFDFKNNYFRSFKFPDFEELYWNDGMNTGNPMLRPEDGWGADLGADWHITENMNLQNVFFVSWLKDSIHWYSGTGGMWQPENVGKALFIGFDSKFYYEIPVKWGLIQKITPAVSYQYLKSYLLSFGYNFNSDKRIPYNPEHSFGASIDISWSNGNAIISGHFESTRYNDRANLTALNPYFLLNAAINQKIGAHCTVFGTLRNILNTSYESFYDYPMPGITLTLGIRINMDIKQGK